MFTSGIYWTWCMSWQETDALYGPILLCWSARVWWTNYTVYLIFVGSMELDLSVSVSTELHTARWQTIACCEGLKSVSSRLDAFSTWRQSFFSPFFRLASLSDTQSEQEVEGCHRKLERSFFHGLSDENVPNFLSASEHSELPWWTWTDPIIFLNAVIKPFHISMD